MVVVTMVPVPSRTPSPLKWDGGIQGTLACWGDKIADNKSLTVVLGVCTGGGGPGLDAAAAANDDGGVLTVNPFMAMAFLRAARSLQYRRLRSFFSSTVRGGRLVVVGATAAAAAAAAARRCR
jgi:hypothetical protein